MVYKYVLIHTFGHEQQEGHFNTKTALRNGTISWTIHIVLHLYTQTHMSYYLFGNNLTKLSQFITVCISLV